MHSEILHSAGTERKPAHKLSIEIITDVSGFDAIAGEWNALVESADVHIFQTYEWQRIWWKYFGGKNRLHILLLRDDIRLVGIVPLFLDHFNLMGIPIYRCLRFLGSRVMQPAGGSVPVELAFSDYLYAIAHPGYEQKVVAAFQNYLPSHRSLCNEIIMEEVPEENPFFTFLLPQFSRSGWNYVIREASVCPFIQLPESWEDFLQNLSSNARYQIRRSVRLADAKNMFEVQTARTKQEVIEAFRRLVDFHQQRWRNIGQPGIFDDKRIHDFFKEITTCFHKKGWLMLKTLRVKGHCVAVDLLFEFKGVIYMMQRGFDDSSPYAKYGVGNILLYCIIKEAIDDGLEAYNFLRGEESYKLRTATHTTQNKELIIPNPEDQSNVRLKLNNIFRNYASLRSKIQNEYRIVGVHFEQQDPFSAMGKYANFLYKRVIRKVSQFAKSGTKSSNSSA